MSSRPEVLHAVRVWVEKAEEDLGVAQRLLGLGEGFNSAITFHAQQASEKYIKALLTLHGVRFPRTHDLVETLLLVPGELQLGIAVSEVAPLNRYAVEARYPADSEPLTEEDAAGAVAAARKVQDSVKPLLPKAVRSD